MTKRLVSAFCLLPLALTVASHVEARQLGGINKGISVAKKANDVRDLSMTDADARMRWATHVSARILAGAFAVAWEWGNTELVSELIEYHSARGSFSTEPDAQIADWAETATAAVPVETADDYALVAGGSSAAQRPSWPG